MRTIASPFTRTVPMSGERLAKGRQIATDTHRWMESHEDAFWAIYGYVKTVKGGRVRDRVASWCVDHGIEVDGDPYTFNNTFWAGISRYLILYDPSLRDNPIKLRESAVDCFGLWPVSYLKIGEGNEERKAHGDDRDGVLGRARPS